MRGAEYIVRVLLESDLSFSLEAEQAIWADLFPASFGLADEFPFDPVGIKRLLAGLDDRSASALWHRYEKRHTFAVSGTYVGNVRNREKPLTRERTRMLIVCALGKMRLRYTR